jgi:hypothetical protein
MAYKEELTPEERAKIKEEQYREQVMAAAADVVPPFHWRLFTNYKTAGFTEEQALRLVLAWIAKPSS